MNLSGQNISQITTIAHDGKVIVFGTAEDGSVHYSVKRSGFEDTALQEGAEPFGFEPWQKLKLGESTDDPSVQKREQLTLCDTSGRRLLRSVYGSSAEVTTANTDAALQVVPALGHLYVFRVAPTGRILVSRFVLDGMTNQLLPKLEVRFARSKQRFTPQSVAAAGGDTFDNLDYRDLDGNSFFEPAIELSFIGAVGNGWFVPLLVPTAEGDRSIWKAAPTTSTTSSAT